MSERKNLSDAPPRGAFLEGAEKFDRIARGVKTPPPGERRTDESVCAQGVSPDEVWARKHAAHVIGAKPKPRVVAGFAPIAHLVSMPKFAGPEAAIEMPPGAREIATRDVAETAGIARRTVSNNAASQPEPAKVAPSGPIGARIGKPVRKRSWIGRLFLGPA